MARKLDRIGVVTSGGDAPGMNAAIRAIVRTAHLRGIEVIGFERGWEGLVDNKYRTLTPRSVGGILELGGTILHTSRYPEFKHMEHRQKASRNLASDGVDGLAIIGGDGSFHGAYGLSEESSIAIVGIPATIDNDVFGTEDTIGFDTAVNTAVAEIDRIRVTAASMERIFVVEVMGRTRGFIAQMVGITSGAETILVPETGFTIEEVTDTIMENSRKGKKSGIVVAAEGIGDTRELARDIERLTGIESRLSVLGYSQRGGSPTARSRLLASMFGDKAVETLLEERENSVIVLKEGKVAIASLAETVSNIKPLDPRLHDLSCRLST